MQRPPLPETWTKRTDVWGRRMIGPVVNQLRPMWSIFAVIGCGPPTFTAIPPLRFGSIALQGLVGVVIGFMPYLNEPVAIGEPDKAKPHKMAVARFVEVSHTAEYADARGIRI